MNQKLSNSFATILIDGFEIEVKTVKYSQMHLQISTHNTAQSFGQFG